MLALARMERRRMSESWAEAKAGATVVGVGCLSPATHSPCAVADTFCMTTHVSATRPWTWVRPETSVRRLAFVALLLAAPLLPHLDSGGFEFPAVSNSWVCLPFCALMLLPLIDVRAPRRLFHFDLLVLLSFVVALGFERPSRVWPVLLIYPPLIYLGVRMAVIARLFRSESPTPTESPRLLLPRSWLVIGIIVLSAVHISWALEATANPDVASGSVHGAVQLVNGRPLYHAPAAHTPVDPHTDTYGPVNYEAYLPFASVADAQTAAHLTTLFFDLLTALLLFALGRQIRGPTAGIVLAYCWLAFPFTLYEDALSFNDSIVAAALVGTLLVARSPARRGVMAAVVGWTKLSPLALVPVLASYRPPRGRSASRGLLEFSLAFAIATAVIFAPTLAHSSLATFMSRTFGFQAERPPAESIWEVLQSDYTMYAPWIGTASRLAHGLLAAITGALAIVLLRAPRRQDIIGLASVSAAVLIALQISLSYYSFSYILWFAPLVLVALTLGRLSNLEEPRTLDEEPQCVARGELYER